MIYLFNNNRRKCQVAIALGILIVSFSACKKGFLDRTPQGRYTTDNYPYAGGSGPYDQYLFGAYSVLREYGVHGAPFIAAVSFRSDDADKGSTPADGGADAQGMDLFPVQPSNGMANNLWTSYFSLISKCNITLDQIYNNKDIVATDEVKKQSEGEARLIRGYAYFMMVRLFGRVPLVDKVYTDVTAQSNIPQSNAAALYTFIESDLQFAAANLPATWDLKFVGRATSGAANGLLAKVYLTQQKWTLAMNTAGLVINSGLYDLTTPYNKIFSEDGENSRESVFEIQGTANATNPTTYGIQYTQIQGVRGSGTWNLGWGWNTPSTYLAGAYETNDPRKTRTILVTSTATTPGITIYGETTPVGLPNPMYNQKVYSDPSVRASVGNLTGYWMNVRILRFADVVLMYAEAANEVNNTTEALAKLEMVRARARAGNNAILPKIITIDQAQIRTAIRQERRIELAMEHDRFFDLVRWGIAASTLQAANRPNFNNNRDNLLPIPQTQIDLSRGVLTQNTGY
jgi:hypothetical protein